MYYTVYYSEEDSIVPKSRNEVWVEISGAENLMDRYDPFLPERFGYRVVQVFLIEDGK